jgi:Tubulin/FtsZ family, GTPase domain
VRSMAIVTLQLGQCGNQLGFDAYDVLAGELLSGSKSMANEMFFRESSQGGYTPRALLLDMEPKVVNTCLLKTSTAGSRWSYDRSNVVVQQSGSGALVQVCSRASAPPRCCPYWSHPEWPAAALALSALPRTFVKQP